MPNSVAAARKLRCAEIAATAFSSNRPVSSIVRYPASGHLNLYRLLHQSRPPISSSTVQSGKAAAMAQTKAKTFLITGVSSGFGRALAQAALRDGHAVVGSVRQESDQADFEKLGQGAHAVILDVTHTAQIAPAIAAIEKNIGAIDVLVNNAGYGHEGILEESSIEDLRRQFEVNVVGAVAMIQHVLPASRKR